MQFHELKRTHENRTKKRVARGGKRGKTAGRGTKGQKARSGHKMRPEMRDIIKKYPKHRGYRFKSFAVKATPVNLDQLEKNFSAGESVTPETLFEKKLIAKIAGSFPEVKVLARGNISKKLSLSSCLVSASAKKAIEDAGGSVA